MGDKARKKLSTFMVHFKENHALDLKCCQVSSSIPQKVTESGSAALVFVDMLDTLTSQEKKTDSLFSVTLEHLIC